MDSMTTLESLGDDPSTHDLDSVMSLLVEEYLTTDMYIILRLWTMNYGIASRSIIVRPSYPLDGTSGRIHSRTLRQPSSRMIGHLGRSRMIWRIQPMIWVDALKQSFVVMMKEGELKDDYTGSITDDLVNYFNRVEVEGDNTDNDKYIDSLFSSSKTTSEAFMCPLSR